MDKILTQFEDIVRRSLGPSFALFTALIVLHLIYAPVLGQGSTNLLEYWIMEIKPHLKDLSMTVIIGLALILLAGLSFIMTTLQQKAIDSRLQENFTGRFHGEASNNLDSLRKRVIDYLKEVVPRLGLDDGVNDYLLYEITGGIDRNSTVRFVDEAKVIGIVALSFVIAQVQVFFAYAPSLSTFCCVIFAIWSLIFCSATYFFGLEAVKGRYRARAIRLYVNVLMMEPETIKETLKDVKKNNPPSN